MPDYYIRTPDRDESRGPFNHSQLLTLAEAGQITQETLYYDDSKKEWIPIALNDELKAEVFPEREKLKLKVQNPVDETGKAKKKEKKKKEKKAPKKEIVNNVADMLADAEKETKSVRMHKNRQESIRKSILFSNNGLSVIMLLFAFTLFAPHMKIISDAVSSQKLLSLFDYPLISLGIIDFLVAIFIFFGSSRMRSYVRVRSMLVFGFGVYIGWSLDDYNVMLASATAGLGTFYTTLSKKYLMTILATIIGLGGSAVLAYFSFIGYFAGLLDSAYLEIPFLR